VIYYCLNQSKNNSETESWILKKRQAWFTRARVNLNNKIPIREEIED